MKRILSLIVAAVAATLTVAFANPAAAQTRYFLVCPGTNPAGCASLDDFVIALSQPKQLQMADQILSGKITDQVHVQGMIVTQPALYNWPWGFYLEPKTISFFTFGHPICWGFSTIEVNANLNKLGSPDFLPTKAWCPRGYRLSKEVYRF
jgi:hypothetical protein